MDFFEVVRGRLFPVPENITTTSNDVKITQSTFFLRWQSLNSNSDCPATSTLFKICIGFFNINWKIGTTPEKGAVRWIDSTLLVSGKHTITYLVLSKVCSLFQSEFSKSAIQRFLFQL
jgi:hypothetical protein